MLTEFRSQPAGLDADQTDVVGVGRDYERMKHARGIGPAADAGGDAVGQFAELIEALPVCFFADDRLEITDDHGERVGAHDAADDVVGGVAGSHPVAHRGVGGVFEGLAARLDSGDGGAHEFHAQDVGALATHVFDAHEDFAVQAELRGGGGGGDAVLAGPGLSNDALLAHTQRQQALTDGIVDLVRHRCEPGLRA